MKKYKLSTIVVTVALLQSAVFADVLISGDIGVAGNWSGGVLPTDPSDPGIIDSSNTGASRGTITNSTARSGLAIKQTGGELTFTGFGTSNFDDVDYEITGGTFASTSFGHKILNGSVFDINGGTVNVVGFGMEGSSTLNMSSGSLNLNGDLTTKTSVYNFSGGTVSVGGDALKSWNTGTLNFSGSTTFDVAGQFGVNFWASSFAVNIGAGNGSISNATLEADSMTIDWITGSDYSFTASSILNGGSAATWEDLWTAGQLTRDGTQSATFAEDFNVAGDTLTVVPEPATLGLVASAGVLLMVFRRRMMK